MNKCPECGSDCVDVVCPPCRRLAKLEVKKLKKELAEAWNVIYVLNMAELDRGQSWDKANFWLSRNESLRYPTLGTKQTNKQKD